MENQTASTTKSDPIIIEQAGMRITVAHRKGLGGSDEGLTSTSRPPGQRTREKEFCASIAFTKTLIITSAPPAAKARLTK